MQLNLKMQCICIFLFEIFLAFYVIVIIDPYKVSNLILQLSKITRLLACYDDCQ